jgi:glycosyltransferase involved in cell wall biosynthesis
MHRLESFVTVTGKVSREELYRHYAEAHVFCLMSQCESFGIPAVEAQAFATPVVGSSTCAMPEVCGEGGVFGEPGQPAQTAELLGEILENPPTWRALSDRARRNAARYRWELCSRPLLKMFGVNGGRTPASGRLCADSDHREAIPVKTLGI